MALTANLSELKAGLDKFLNRCKTEFCPAFQNGEAFVRVSDEEVSALLLRLAHNVLPNIVPDATLLGVPATFATILNACLTLELANLSDSPISLYPGLLVGQLVFMAELVELNHLEWSKVPDNDETNQKWADLLLAKAKQLGWFRLCIKHRFLTEKYIHWPNHNWVKQPKLKEVKGESQSVRTISGGAFEQKRRKH